MMLIPSGQEIEVTRRGTLALGLGYGLHRPLATRLGSYL